MKADDPYLVDSNILLRLVKRDHPEYPLVRAAVTALRNRGAILFYAMQNMAEFWNASTRPLENNGFGLSIEEADAGAREIEAAFTFLPDNKEVYLEWRRLVVMHAVRGVRVHDARLAAILYTYGLSHILSFNGVDFQRYSGITAVHPADAQRSGSQP